MKTKRPPQSYLIPLVILVTAVLSAVNIYGLVQEIRERRQLPLSFSGLRFAGLNTILGETRIVGYFTDRDLDEPQNLAQFQQAQYMLAPIILELNNPDHRFVLVDCENDRTAMLILKKFDLRPLKRNNLGIILAVNPRIKE